MTSLSVALVTSLLALAPAVLPQEDGSEDVDVLLEAVARIHPDPFRTNPRERWEAEADRLRARLPELAPHEVKLGLQRLLALAGDGHTETVHRDAALGGPWLPVIVRRFADGWFVRTAHRDCAPLFGLRLTHLAGAPIEAVAARLRPFVSADNELGALDGIGNLMRLPAALHAAGVTDAPAERVEYAAVDADGVRTVLEVAAGSESWVTPAWTDADADVPGDKPRYRRMDGNYSFVHVPEEDLVHVWFDSVRDDDGETIAEFFERVFAHVREHDVERLVLDLRENSGGNLDLCFPVLHGILRSPVDAPGRLFVVTGRDTYSAAMYLAVLLERHTHALFVGEPTGSRPSLFGDTVELTLPKSRLAIEVSELHWQPGDPRDRRPWITPDLPAPLTSDDFFAHRDPALEAILDFVPDADLEAGFGPPVHRWRRASQRQEQRWPGVVAQPASSRR